MADTTLSQKPKVVNLDGYAGDKFVFTVPVIDADGSPANLDDQTLLAQIRLNPNSAVLGELDIKTFENVMTITLSYELATSLPSKTVFDLEWVERRRTLIKGRITLDDQITIVQES